VIIFESVDPEAFNSDELMQLCYNQAYGDAIGILNCTYYGIKPYRTAICQFATGSDVSSVATARRAATISFQATVNSASGVSAVQASQGVTATDLASSIATVVASNPAYSAIVVPSATSIESQPPQSTHTVTYSDSDSTSNTTVAMLIVGGLLALTVAGVAIGGFVVMQRRRTASKATLNGMMMTNVNSARNMESKFMSDDYMDDFEELEGPGVHANGEHSPSVTNTVLNTNELLTSKEDHGPTSHELHELRTSFDPVMYTDSIIRTPRGNEERI